MSDKQLICMMTAFIYSGYLAGGDATAVSLENALNEAKEIFDIMGGDASAVK